MLTCIVLYGVIQVSFLCTYFVCQIQKQNKTLFLSQNVFTTIKLFLTIGNTN